MKLILAFVAIVGLAAADDLSDLKTFLTCLDKALTDGLPSVGIPPHDPLQIKDDTDSAPIYSITNQIVHGLLNYTFPVLDVAEKSSNPDIVVFDYAIHWPKVIYSGSYSYLYQILDFISISDSGTYEIVIENLTWSGIFNLTKPGQEGYSARVNDFTVSSIAENIQVKTTNSGNDIWDVKGLLKSVYTGILNDFPAYMAEDIRNYRFNEYWIGHPEKIRAVMDHCGLSN